jgi:hypothetical protein
MTFSTTLPIQPTKTPPNLTTPVMPTSPSRSQKASTTTNPSTKNPPKATTTKKFLQQTTIKISPRMHYYLVLPLQEEWTQAQFSGQTM